jgi:hypothetical protein
MHTSIALGIMAVLLAACAAPANIAAFEAEEVNAKAQDYGPPCEKLGYAAGTDPWRACIIRSSRRNELAQQALFYDRYVQWYWLRP